MIKGKEHPGSSGLLGASSGPVSNLLHRLVSPYLSEPHFIKPWNEKIRLHHFPFYVNLNTNILSLGFLLNKTLHGLTNENTHCFVALLESNSIHVKKF